MMKKPVLLLSLFVITVQLFLYTTAQGSQRDVCIGSTCSECIASGPSCGWCKQENFDDRKYDRCSLLTTLVAQECDMGNIITPDHEVTPDRDDSPRNAVGGADAIQLQPQELSVKLRPNKPLTFNVHYRQAENYPIDLYFVMDLSYSLKDDKEMLANLGDDLAEELRKITKDFKIGFGSFVDKKALPYVSITPDTLEKPCGECVAAYGFRNHLALSTNINEFKRGVQDAPISGNLDGPEGGFDALMQAVVCEGKIGWRSNSRKLIVYSTDESFHSAGDGILAGIVKPNDGQCHMDTANYYTESLNQDYPSISQLAQKIAENNVVVIFAVTEGQVDLYNQLRRFIKGSEVGILANDSNNIVQLVKDTYDKIAQEIVMKARADDGVQVSFKSSCLDPTQPPQETATCSGIKIGKNVTYEVTVMVKSCPKDRNEWKKTVDIYPQGLSERLRLHLDLNCECPCEEAGQGEANSTKCSNRGTYACGSCNCNEGFQGPECECDTSDSGAGVNLEAKCRMSNTSAICESRGVCNCGVCKCNAINPKKPTQLYSGKHCECNDYSCNYYNNQLCGGTDRGTCVCGACVCEPDYTGKACDCSLRRDECIASNGKECNGKGRCICGKCECDRGSEYRGPTCEDCPTCTGLCPVLKECAICSVRTGNPDECGNCTLDYNIEMKDEVRGIPNWRFCQAKYDDDDCPRGRVYYRYAFDSKDVHVQKKPECIAAASMKVWIPLLILAVVLIGLLLLCIWRLCVYLYDRREYALLQKEIDNAKWETDMNPIFKPATSTYKNPMKD